MGVVAMALAALGQPRPLPPPQPPFEPHLPAPIKTPQAAKRKPLAVVQRNSTTGTLQARIVAVVVEPMKRLRMRECP